MKLLHRIWSRWTPPAAPPAPQTASNNVGSDGDPACLGCGWFDSSHELQSGLRVTEHADDDIVVAALPVATWLEMHLAGWQPDAQAGGLCQ